MNIKNYLLINLQSVTGENIQEQKTSYRRRRMSMLSLEIASASVSWKSCTGINDLGHRKQEAMNTVQTLALFARGASFVYLSGRALEEPSAFHSVS